MKYDECFATLRVVVFLQSKAIPQKWPLVIEPQLPLVTELGKGTVGELNVTDISWMHRFDSNSKNKMEAILGVTFKKWKTVKYVCKVVLLIYFVPSFMIKNN